MTRFHLFEAFAGLAECLDIFTQGIPLDGHLRTSRPQRHPARRSPLLPI
jgi:hypothetical protein